jgi:hypothetical protein
MHPSYEQKSCVRNLASTTMVSIVIPPKVVLTPAQSYSSEEWEQKRSIITHLYRDETKSLYDVRIILVQQHAFRPT